MNRRDAMILTDDAQAGAVCQAALRESGLNTEWIWQGDAALERLEQVQPALVIVDVELPGISGLEILAHVRRQTAAQIMLITADVIVHHAEGRGSKYL